ncbi:two-component sensor histidine kinase [Spirochaetia bacterium]|nr:two-component sensor histidine kinase [Spirochaetia bacterium]
MTIKKRLFFSNLLMAIAPLAAFLIVFSVADEMEDTFLKDTGDDEIRTVTAPLFEIQSLVDNADPVLLLENSDAQRELLEKTAAKGYHLEAAQNGRVLFSSLSGKEKSRIAKYVGPVVLSPAESDSRTLWVYNDERKFLRHSVETLSPPLVFSATGIIKEKKPEKKKEAGSAVLIITGGILLIAAAILTVILVSLFLAKRIVKNIVIPLDNLCEGAERIQEGNLDENIPSGGVEELEKVCGAFNEMQRRLKANIQKNLVYEANRKEMLAGISHDLRTPLTSIKNYVKGLQDEIAKTPEKQREYLDVVYRKSCVMEVLINQLFLFSKLETGNLPFQFKPVPIQKYMVTVLDSLEYDLKKNDAALTLDSSCTNEEVFLDTEQMTRVITNILENSVKYNPGRHINITVTVSPVRETGKLVIRIQDDGAGVPEKQFPHLFESFYRGDESRNNYADGSGLGLAIAKNIVIAHNGSISAENQNGLAITITLPMEKEKENES